MESFIAKPRKWGSSVGVIIPKDVIEREGIQTGEELQISVAKRGKTPFQDMFGTLEDNTPTQKIMEELDESDD